MIQSAAAYERRRLAIASQRAHQLTRTRESVREELLVLASAERTIPTWVKAKLAAAMGQLKLLKAMTDVH